MNQEKESDLKNLLILIGICLIIALVGGSIGLGVRKCSGDSRIHPEVRQYIGDWQGGKTVVRIEPRAEKKVRESFVLKDGRIANLLMPVRVRNVKGGSLDIMLREGIYEIGDEHGLIYQCKLCDHYILFGLRMEGNNLWVGIPKYGFNDRHIHDFIGRHRNNWKGTRWTKFKWSNFNWVPYEQAETEGSNSAGCSIANVM